MPPAATTSRNEETISLTTLILAVVIAFVVSAIVVVISIILFRCVWIRMRKKKRQHLDLTTPTGLHHQSNGHLYNEMSVINPVTAQDLKAAEAYDVPATLQCYSTYSQITKQDLENTYEAPMDGKKVQARREDRLYSNTSFGSRKLSSTDYSLPPLPMESEYSFMHPRNTPANLQGNDEDYCDIDALEGKLDLGDQHQSQEGQNGLSESNIYEPLPF